MAEVSANPAPGKRSLQDVKSLPSDDAPSAKRPCLESPPPSAHLSLLEELCDLEAEDAESSLQPLVSGASPLREDLVAEMMKSLEKVIEGSNSRGAGEASTSHPCSGAASPVRDASNFGLAWSSDNCPVPEQDLCSHGELLQHDDDTFDGDARIQHLLQASDDELGIPLSSSSSELDDSSFHEEWASLADETGSSNFNLSWLDGSLQQFEEARDLYEHEPVILF
ncbi:hypothetical protein GOP47_0007836 [Adiantum capillus-veneris]|uniref:Uncharacterized protein n=1 Tax=Adiantum capillus-veneris TaxID=13818 RepID=A0A9D4V302_ADICA|nr:hypothetical protein GOP47_0007836 [Adiantum capillus-veneris]